MKLKSPQIRHRLEAAGVEVFHEESEELHIAERVRLHIMDSGIRVRAKSHSRVEFTARCQRSDYPETSDAALVERVRQTVGAPAEERGFRETTIERLEVRSPSNDDDILDIWHQLTYEMETDQPAEIVSAVQWALSLERRVL
jgi:hypothetical protein